MNAPFSIPENGFEPGRLWSLWDMINYHLFPLCHLLITLTNFEEKLRERSAILQGGNMNEEIAKALGTTIVVTEKDRNHIGALMKVSKQISDQMMLEKVAHRIRRFEKKLRSNISMSDFYAEARTLRESIEDDVKSNYLYLYPNDKAIVIAGKRGMGTCHSQIRIDCG
jgi:hypothetical protein